MSFAPFLLLVCFSHPNILTEGISWKILFLSLVSNICVQYLPEG